MPGIVDFFCQTYLRKHNSEKLIDLKILVEDLQNFSPIMSPELPVSDPEECIRNIPGMVVRNFAQNFGTTRFHIKGLTVLARILQKQDVDARIQQMMLIHITKCNISIAKSVVLYTKIEKMVIRTTLSDQSEMWRTLALRTMQHPQIMTLIDDLIEKNFDSIKINSPGPISVNFFSIEYHAIRGFAGLNAIYINEKHFHDNFVANESDVRATFITKIDIISIALHEYAHVRMRQKLNDFNVSTQFVIKNEIGRMVEIEVFNGQINWWESLETVDINYIRNFISAIEEGTELPTFSEYDIPAYRTSSVVFGVDMEEDDDFLC